MGGLTKAEVRKIAADAVYPCTIKGLNRYMLYGERNFKFLMDYFPVKGRNDNRHRPWATCDMFYHSQRRRLGIGGRGMGSFL